MSIATHKTRASRGGTVTVPAQLLQDLVIAAEGAAESIEALREGGDNWPEYDSWVDEARKDATAARALLAEQTEDDAPTMTGGACARCGCELEDNGHCSDATCAFSDCTQDDARGWEGHPEARRMQAPSALR